MLTGGGHWTSPQWTLDKPGSTRVAISVRRIDMNKVS